MRPLRLKIWISLKKTQQQSNAFHKKTTTLWGFNFFFYFNLHPICSWWKCGLPSSLKSLLRSASNILTLVLIKKQARSATKQPFVCSLPPKCSLFASLRKTNALSDVTGAGAARSGHQWPLCTGASHVLAKIPRGKKEPKEEVKNGSYGKFTDTLLL